MTRRSSRPFGEKGKREAPDGGLTDPPEPVDDEDEVETDPGAEPRIGRPEGGGWTGSTGVVDLDDVHQARAAQRTSSANKRARPVRVTLQPPNDLTPEIVGPRWYAAPKPVPQELTPPATSDPGSPKLGASTVPTPQRVASDSTPAERVSELRLGLVMGTFVIGIILAGMALIWVLGTGYVPGGGSLGLPPAVTPADPGPE